MGGIFASRFAEGGTVGFAVQHVIDHLEGQPDAVGKVFELLGFCGGEALPCLRPH